MGKVFYKAVLAQAILAD